MGTKWSAERRRRFKAKKKPATSARSSARRRSSTDSSPNSSAADAARELAKMGEALSAIAAAIEPLSIEEARKVVTAAAVLAGVKQVD